MRAPRSSGFHTTVTRLLSLENTLNGGVVPPAQLAAAAAAAKEMGLATHLDGARLWNASAASGASLCELSAGFDSVSVCLSKG